MSYLFGYSLDAWRGVKAFFDAKDIDIELFEEFSNGIFDNIEEQRVLFTTLSENRRLKRELDYLKSKIRGLADET